MASLQKAFANDDERGPIRSNSSDKAVRVGTTCYDSIAASLQQRLYASAKYLLTISNDDRPHDALPSHRQGRHGNTDQMTFDHGCTSTPAIARTHLVPAYPGRVDTWRESARGLAQSGGSRRVIAQGSVNI